MPRGCFPLPLPRQHRQAVTATQILPYAACKTVRRPKGTQVLPLIVADLECHEAVIRKYAHSGIAFTKMSLNKLNKQGDNIQL